MQKTLSGQSFVLVSVPDATVKLLLFPDWSVTELLSFKIKKPSSPYSDTLGSGFIFHSPVVESVSPNTVVASVVPSTK